MSWERKTLAVLGAGLFSFGALKLGEHRGKNEAVQNRTENTVATPNSAGRTATSSTVEVVTTPAPTAATTAETAPAIPRAPFKYPLSLPSGLSCVGPGVLRIQLLETDKFPNDPAQNHSLFLAIERAGGGSVRSLSKAAAEDLATINGLPGQNGDNLPVHGYDIPTNCTYLGKAVLMVAGTPGVLAAA